MARTTRPNQLALGWGGGSFDVIMDLSSQALYPYASSELAERVHDRLGGRRYYRSQSGLSGAGFVEATFGLRQLATYRVDSYYVAGPRMEDLERTLPDGTVILAPIDYGQHTIPTDWPVVLLKGLYKTYEGNFKAEQIMMLDQSTFQDHLRGQASLEQRSETFRFIRQPYDLRLPDTKEREFKFLAPAPEGRWRAPHLNYRQALMGLFRAELRFDTEGYEETPSVFWNRLGLRLIEGRLYKVSQKICWQAYERADLATIQSLQDAAPAGTLVLTPTLYLQDRGSFSAAALVEVDGQEISVEEHDIPLPDAIRATNGDFEFLQTRLAEQARSKVEWERKRAEATASPPPPPPVEEEGLTLEELERALNADFGEVPEDQ